MKKIREWVSVKTVTSPRLIVLLFVLVANVAFIGAAATVIFWLSPSFPEEGGFWTSMFNTIIMYLGIGGIDMVIEDISQVNMLLVLSCIVIILIGLVFFTYALIGYMSDFISNFIGDANSGSRRLHISGHIVILNWNSRAAEIINDLLYRNTKEKIVILAANDRDEILSDIDERISDTVETENDAASQAAADMSFFERRRYMRNNGIKNKLTIIVREGSTYSIKQLNDISIKQAESVIILSDADDDATMDSHTIKTLIQVAQMTAAEDSADDQQIVVEVEDEKTLALVEKIIKHKMRRGKCNIVPVSVNKILGYIFSQFSIMPELNMVYSTLFSYKDTVLLTQPISGTSVSDTEFVSEYLSGHSSAIPLCVMECGDGKQNSYYVADEERDIHIAKSMTSNNDLRVSLNPDFEIRERPIIILGHSSKSSAMMDGFASFNNEWKKADGAEALDVTIIDDEEGLVSHEHYKQYPWVKKVITAEIFEQDVICDAIGDFIDANGSGGCILILSDDTAAECDIDENALTYLILLQDIIINRLENNPNFDLNAIDMIVEILDPQNHDIINHYDMKNVVISNRYVSKMIVQVSKDKALFELYQDILTYDEENSDGVSKEMYIKRADEFFGEIPKPSSAADLIRAVYHASPDDNKSVLLGYFSPDGEMTMFSGEQSNIYVELSGKEKLILFSDH